MPKTFTRKKIFVVALVMITAFVGLFTRLSYLMLVRSDYYYQKAQALHERERSIKAKRGVIYDRNGVEMAGNKPVCSVSVIHSQVTNEDEVVKQLCRVLNLYISIDVNIQKYAEQAATKVLKAKQAKRVSVILMNPQNGEIYAMVNVPEYNLNEPFTLVSVEDLYIDRTEDVEENADEKTEENKLQNMTEQEKQDALNGMWRNFCINDTYEPGSTFKIVTATAALEEGVVRVDDTFSCPGFRIVEDRRIRCHKVGGHGTETFRQGIMNSCNPVFIDVGARVGVDNMYKNYRKLGLFEKTGIDLPGEASSIMHKQEDVGAVELATMSFGQSFQITPLQLRSCEWRNAGYSAFWNVCNR